MSKKSKGLSARAWFYGASGFGHSGANVPQRTAPEAPGNRVEATIDSLVEMVCCAEVAPFAAAGIQSSEEQSTGTSTLLPSPEKTFCFAGWDESADEEIPLEDLLEIENRIDQG